MCVKAPYNACICNLNLCVEEPTYIGYRLNFNCSLHPSSPRGVGGGGGRSQDLLPNSSWELSLLQVKQCYNNIDSQTKNTKVMHTFMHPLICNNSLHFKTRSVKIKYMCMYVRLTTNTTIQISLFFSTISDTA